ncbi:JmjC domain-containing protein [Nocardia crassostreae]|uniref:JmjC domain-containing protein n=1 Tax=Nocardia crassostreae TaxID=53428 RepID=UPI000835929D|nr:cupin domain-containing protein [Nocardia crassostreae]
MDELEQCVGSAEAFLSTLWRQAPAVLRPAAPPVELLSVADVLAILDDGLLGGPYVRLFTADGRVPADRYCLARWVSGEPVPGYIDPAAVHELLHMHGATVLLRHIGQWHRGIRDFIGGLSVRLHRRVEAFFVLSSRQPTAAHRDDADLLVVQVSGAKRWRIYPGPADGHWVPGPTGGDLGAPILDAVLHRGEVLYVPRGFAHDATTESAAPSAHLALAIREAGTEHLLTATRGMLATGIQLPARPLTDTALTAAARALIGHMSDRLNAITPEAVVAAARAIARPSREA